MDTEAGQVPRIGAPQRLLAFASRGATIRGWYGVVVGFFLLLVLVPTLFVISFFYTGWGNLERYVFSSPDLLVQILSAVGLSFGVALTITAVDLVFGLPLAWFIVRKEFRGKALVNTLVDSPLAVPTAGLGFSVALFWAANPTVNPPPLSLNVTNSPFLLLTLLHFTTTFPYMVRSLSAILEQIEIEYEIAARTCGAAPLTAARTVTLPLFRSGMATGAILCLAKAISDTGGVQGALTTARLFDLQACGYSGTTSGTVLIGAWRTIGKTCSDPSVLAQVNAGLPFVAILMILLSLLLLFVVKLLAARVKFPLRRVWPGPERRLSRGVAPRARDIASFAFLGFMILLPSFFIMGFLVTGSAAANRPLDWGGFFGSLGVSFLVAGVATALDLAFGIPLALYIVRGPRRRLGSTLDSLVNVPYIVPSAALGYSLFLFWSPLVASGVLPILIIIVFAHVAFTFPFVVRNVVGALEEMEPGLDETARTLGAKPAQAFRRVTFPVVKPAILAGSIMAFTRSVGETGATQAVAPSQSTAPVFIVNLLTAGRNAVKAGGTGLEFFYLAALAVAVLTLVSAVTMLAMRYATRRAR